MPVYAAEITSYNLLSPLVPVLNDNYIVVKNTGTTDLINYPVRIGRQFANGEIINYPEAQYNTLSINTQSNIKQRWPNGTVKHAVISFIVDTIVAGETKTIKFVNSATTFDTPLTKTEMLAVTFNFDAKIDLDFYDHTESISARTMLNADHYTDWCPGQIANTVILRDYSPTKTYAVGNDANKSLWPAFEVTFWKDINQFEVRYIVESPDTETLQDQSYDISLKILDSDSEIYTKSNFYHRGFARWTKKYWSDSHTEINCDHNLAYLSSTFALPNFDTTRGPLATDIDTFYQQYTSMNTDLGDAGSWSTRQGNSGARNEIGHITTELALWLYTGDSRHKEIVLSEANLAGNWSNHIREGDSGRFFDFDSTIDNYSLPISIAPNGRTEAYLLYSNLDSTDIQVSDRINELSVTVNSDIYYWYRVSDNSSFSVSDSITCEGTTTVIELVETRGEFYLIKTSDRLVHVEEGVSTIDGTSVVVLEYMANWQNDTSHYPNFSAITYALTGDHYYMEEVMFDAAYVTSSLNPTASDFIRGRGQYSYDGACLGSQIRGQAWGFNIRMYAELVLPDSSPMQSYLSKLNKNAISYWCGLFDVNNPYTETDRIAMHTHARNVLRLDRFSVVNGNDVGTLGFMRDEAYNDGTIDDWFLLTDVTEAAATWQHNYFIGVLGRAKELGYPVEDLLTKNSQYIRNIFNTTSDRKHMIAAYVFGTIDNNNDWFEDVEVMFDFYLQSQVDYVRDVYIPLDVRNQSSAERYHTQARAAASFLSNEDYGVALWQWMLDNVNNKQAFDVNPKWALLPRE